MNDDLRDTVTGFDSDIWEGCRWVGAPMALARFRVSGATGLTSVAWSSG